MKTFISRSPAETGKLAGRLARKLKGGEIIALSGPLGAGKTVFVKGLAQALGIDERKVKSPSFMLMFEYRQGRLPLFHFDFYRITRPGEIETLPFADCCRAKGVTVIEWPERVAAYLPPETRRVSIAVTGPKSRRIRLG